MLWGYPNPYAYDASCEPEANGYGGCMVNENIIWYTGEAAADDRISDDSISIGEYEDAGNARKEASPQSSLIARVLDDIGLSVQMCSRTDQLGELLKRGEASLLVAQLVDVPGWEGWQVVDQARSDGKRLPVLAISGASGGDAAEASLKSGANDYMAYPLHEGELAARVMNLLELAGIRSRQSVLKIGGLVLDRPRRCAMREGQNLQLTSKEFALLYFLAENCGEVCSREMILRRVWGYHFHAGTNVVDVYIRHLRVKVDKGHRQKLIHTVRGEGYVVRAPDEAPYS
ncbi:response regulator transcription factor [Paenibacillus sp. HN-1]|uniref:response regulator transcription factor n=1 Tax=Paenibacillus sp. CGMCC 1.18879 TaxID=2834466 RepID=UPI001CA9EF62|nr:response regulator transcription factor [Paenibacillus sp. CGMCC 1.18879]MBY9082054.1 response regulator transcription factor [Paenibacillus sp. CGMCC 1.18879]MBY9085788.1 response regulator transcription factor [Paenibacillus sinensis]